MRPTSEHWDSIFSVTDDKDLGWYEDDVSQTLRLLKPVPGWENAHGLLVGAGTSKLIDTLLNAGVHLSVNDISPEAINKVKERLGKNSTAVNFFCQDISQPITKQKVQRSSLAFDLWIDRAVLHFLTDEDSISGYFKNLKLHLKQGGHVLFAEFSTSGAEKCAGLPIHRYSVNELSKRLGSEFSLVKKFDHIYTRPDGNTRPYIYCLYKKDGHVHPYPSETL